MIEIDEYEDQYYRRNPDPLRNETKGKVQSDDGYWYSMSSCDPDFIEEINEKYEPRIGDM